MGRPDRVAYVAAKSGILGLTRALAVDLTGKNINVNTICPGLISTPFNQNLLKTLPMERLGKRNNSWTLGLPSDISWCSCFFI